MRTLLLCLLIVSGTLLHAQMPSKPNIIIVYVDDLGFGDLSCYGAKLVQTPNVDALAAGGMRFTDAHCTAATCTPSRYSLLTGSYAFRNKAAILPGDAPLLINPATPTLPGMLRKQGYKTAVIGKWHLGLGNGVIDWNTEIKPGPLEVGFDYSFIIPATLDRVPCVYVQDHKVVNLDPRDPIAVSYKNKIGNLPTGLEEPGMLKYGADTQHSNTIINGISRIGYMTGGKSALWVDENMADVLAGQVDQYIARQKDPFFLYYSFTDIHVPRAPNARFRGNTMGLRGDAITQMDWMVGALMQSLTKYKKAENTLIIFTSDNGPVLDDGYYDEAEEKVGTHKPAGPFRGGKYSAYEAGTRVSTIVYWKNRVTPGLSNAMLSQVDLYASLAKLTGGNVSGDAAPDSFNYLDAWLGKTDKGRKAMIEESFTFALRDGKWKYIAPQKKKTPDWMVNKKSIESGLSTQPQLYNMESDPLESRNLAEQNPKIVKEMDEKLQRLMKAKGSR